jgi:segregation and condensation protein B
MTETKRAIEAVLMAAIEPIEPQLLAQLTETPVDEIEALCTELHDEYERDGRGFTLVKIAGGYRYQTHADMAPYIERFVLDGQSARLSGPALETLAIIAYKQPVSRADIEIVRGVNSDGVMAHLLSKGLVKIVGRKEVPGRPFLYGTTKEFLEYFGLKSLEDLPKLEEFPLLAASGDAAGPTEAGEIQPGATAETVEEEQKITASLDAFEQAAEHEGAPSTENTSA